MRGAVSDDRPYRDLSMPDTFDAVGGAKEAEIMATGPTGVEASFCKNERHLFMFLKRERKSSVI